MAELQSVFPTTPEAWEDELDSALEHASHVAKLLVDAGLLHVRDKDAWPGGTLEGPGTVGYHFMAMLEYVYDVFQGLALVVPDVDDSDGPASRE